MKSLVVLGLALSFAGTLRAADPKVTQADLKEIHLFIDNFSGASGSMPDVKTTYAALVEAKAASAALVKSGAIVLTGSRTRESVWAYVAAALTDGGLAVTNSGVETFTADELKKRIGKR